MNRYGYSSKLWSQPIATNKYKIIVYLVEVQDRSLGTYGFWPVQNEFVIFRQVLKVWPLSAQYHYLCNLQFQQDNLGL